MSLDHTHLIVNCSISTCSISTCSYMIPWEGEDNRGQKVASGVYFVRMVARDFRSTKKLLVLK